MNFVIILMRCFLSAEYVHRVFKVQNPTVYKISWKGVEKEELDTSKLYTAPDDNREEEEDDDILKWIKIIELYS